MKKLSDLKAHEVSLVKRGANKKPFLVLKNDRGESMAQAKPHMQFKLTADQAEAEDAFIERCMSRVIKADGASPLSDRAQAALKAVYRILLPFKAEITDADIDELAETIGVGQADESDAPTDSDDVVAEDEEVAQSADQDKDKDQGDEMANKADDQDKPAFLKAADVKAEDHQAAMKAAKEAYKKALGATNKAADDESEESDKKEDGVTKSADITKSPDWASLPAQVRAHFESVTKSADAEKRAWIEKSAGLEARVRKMEDEKEMAGYQAIVKSELRGLSLDVDKTCKVMKSLASVGPEELEGYVSHLRSLNEQVKVNKSFESAGGLFGSAGQSAGAAHSGQISSYASSESGAQAKADELAKQYQASHVAKADGTSMSFNDAYAAIMATPQGVDLYEQITRESRG